MIVMLQKDNQFGEPGPQNGARGVVAYIIKDSDGDYYAATSFKGFFDGIYNVPLDHLMIADTSGTYTHWTTWVTPKDKD